MWVEQILYFVMNRDGIFMLVVSLSSASKSLLIRIASHLWKGSNTTVIMKFEV